MRNGCSDRLVRIGETGTDLTFEEIINTLYRGQVSEELGPPFDDPEIEKCATEMNEAADLALKIWQISSNDEAAAQAMQRTDNQYVIEIGEALESGDWSALAI